MLVYSVLRRYFFYLPCVMYIPLPYVTSQYKYMFYVNTFVLLFVLSDGNFLPGSFLLNLFCTTANNVLYVLRNRVQNVLRRVLITIGVECFVPGLSVYDYRRLEIESRASLGICYLGLEKSYLTHKT